MFLHVSTKTEEEKNTYYPRTVPISSLDDLKHAVRYDHMASKMRNDRRGNNNFLETDCIMLDLDNTHSEDPSEWKTLDDVADTFPDVKFYAIRSRNYMKVKAKTAKDGTVTQYEAREKYHLYFPLSGPIDGKAFDDIVCKTVGLFMFFDMGAMDKARFFYGVKDPQGEYYDGSLNLDQYVGAVSKEDVIRNIKDNYYQIITEDPDHDKAVKKLLTYFGLNTEETDNHAGQLRDKYYASVKADSIAWLEKWAAANSVSLGRRYDFSVEKHPGATAICVKCPWEHEHSMTGSDNESIIIIEENGKLDYKCFHSHGHRYGWKEYRAEIEKRSGKAAESREPPAKSIKLKRLSDIPEEAVEWLISGYIPKGQITLLAGDGGSGKSSIWCNLIAALTTGKKSILDEAQNIPFAEIQEPQTVVFLSTEDSASKVVKGRLRLAGADMDYVYCLNLSDEELKDIKFNSDELATIVSEYRPALCVFDPLQSFVPANINMAARNAMRQCMSPLIGLGEKYGTTFLIIMHTNKKMNVSGRSRLADSADAWDIARSVLICGVTEDKDIRYLSHEKCNYGRLQDTVLFGRDDAGAYFISTTDKRDYDYMHEFSQARPAPARDSVKDQLVSLLDDGALHEVDELDKLLKAAGASISTIRRAKEDLKRENRIRYVPMGFGREKKWYLKLMSERGISDEQVS